MGDGMISETLAAMIPMPTEPDWANLAPDDDVACGTVYCSDGHTVTVELTADATDLGKAFSNATEAALGVILAWRRTAHAPERYWACRELAGG